ncbi:MAG TPA: hypothetical protein VMV07_17610 [Streptosporangiaceae bacterium]|nr:hypothetical protein [Streptosporangiaceae bacterium]
MAKTPEVGQPAPDAQRGQPLVLAFYPGDDSVGCTRQMCSVGLTFPSAATITGKVATLTGS